MSLPFTRRIARAALLVAAAAPMVGVSATAAQAAQPHTPDLGGLTDLDPSAGLGDTARDTLPAATRTLGGAAHNAAPAAENTLRNTSTAVDEVNGQAGRSLRDSDLVSSEALPVSPLPSLPRTGQPRS